MNTDPKIYASTPATSCTLDNADICNTASNTPALKEAVQRLTDKALSAITQMQSVVDTTKRTIEKGKYKPVSENGEVRQLTESLKKAEEFTQELLNEREKTKEFYETKIKELSNQIIKGQIHTGQPEEKNNCQCRGIFENGFLLEKNSITWFWKALAPSDSKVDLAELADKGVSALLHELLDDLVPLAIPLPFQGAPGIARKYTGWKPLPQIQGNENEVDWRLLTKRQRQQLFMHWLVDFLVSHHDAHSRNFYITNEGSIIAVNKSQAFRYVKGREIAAGQAMQGYESAFYTPSHPFAQFCDLAQDPVFSIYAQLDSAIKGFGICKVSIRRNDELRAFIERVKGLTHQKIAACLAPYATAGFPGEEEELYQEVLTRCQSLPEQVDTYLSRFK